MYTPEYVVKVQDHAGDTWEVEVASETNVDRLLAVEMLLKDICVTIQHQLEDESRDDIEWRLKASRTLRYKQQEVKYVKRRIKHLTDPSGEVGVKNREITSLEQGARKELTDLLDYLEDHYLDILDKYYEDMEG